MEGIVEGLTAIGMLGICFGLYRIANGRLKSKVNRDACHTAQSAVRERIDILEKHLDQRLDDLKDFIEKNGK